MKRKKRGGSVKDEVLECIKKALEDQRPLTPEELKGSRLTRAEARAIEINV